MPDLDADGSATGFLGLENVLPGLSQTLGQQVKLRGFAATFRAFESDKPAAASHVASASRRQSAGPSSGLPTLRVSHPGYTGAANTMDDRSPSPEGRATCAICRAAW